MADGTEGPRRGRPRRLSKEELRTRVIDAAVEVFGVDGPQASIDAIARAAGVAKPAVYELFGSKDELLAAATAAEVDTLLAGLDAAQPPPSASTRARTRARISAVFDYAAARPAGVRLLSAVETASSRSVGVMRSARSRAVDRLADVIRDDFARAGQDVGVAADVLATMLVTMVVEVARRAADESWPSDDVVDLMTSFVTAGLRTVDSPLPNFVPRGTK